MLHHRLTCALPHATCRPAPAIAVGGGRATQPVRAHVRLRASKRSSRERWHPEVLCVVLGVLLICFPWRGPEALSFRCDCCESACFPSPRSISKRALACRGFPRAPLSFVVGPRLSKLHFFEVMASSFEAWLRPGGTLWLGVDLEHLDWIYDRFSHPQRELHSWYTQPPSVLIAVRRLPGNGSG